MPLARRQLLFALRPTPRKGPLTINALAITAITDFALAVEACFLGGLLMQAPKERLSAAWYWSVSMLLLGTAALLGGIDHGFIEPAGLPRSWIQRLTWSLLGATTFCIVQTIAAQFFAGRTAYLISRAGIVQLALYLIVVLGFDSFFIAVLNYSPVMLWFLLLNVAHLRDGRGSWQMICGVCLLVLASTVQVLGVDVLSPVDHNGLYHLISMPALLLLFFGGRRLATTKQVATRSAV